MWIPFFVEDTADGRLRLAALLETVNAERPAEAQSITVVTFASDRVLAASATA